MNYMEELEEDYKEQLLQHDDTTRLEFLSDDVFMFDTYDSEKAELFATKAIEVCNCITDKTTYEYHEKSDDNYNWFLIMVNMPFFVDKLEWGCSVRGAWWKYELNYNKFFDDDTCLNRDEFIKFIGCINEFIKG